MLQCRVVVAMARIPMLRKRVSVLLKLLMRAERLYMLARAGEDPSAADRSVGLLPLMAEAWAEPDW